MKHIKFFKILACLFPIIFMVALCSCEQETNNTTDENPSPTLTLVPTTNDTSSSDTDISSETTTPSGAVASPESVVPSEISPMSMYKSVLLNDAEFFSTAYKKNMNITQLTASFDGDAIKIIKFTVIDLDHDGTPEVILWMSINEDMNYGFEVLRYHDEVVYDYNFTYRAFLNLKADGTFMVSGGAMDYGFGTISFTDDTWMIDRMASCESNYDADNNLSNSYFVNHESATEEEFLSAVNKQSEKPDAVWYDFTDDNIDISVVDSDSESGNTINDVVFYDCPITVKIPSIKTIDSSLEETALTPSPDAPNPGGWEETCYIYPFDDNNRQKAESDKENYINLLTKNGFVSDERGFYVNENIGVTCGLVFTSAPGGELTVFIFENFDKYKSNDDFFQRSFGE